MSSTTVFNGIINENKLLKSGLEKLGIDADYEIIIPDNFDIVENTAADMLQAFLKKVGLHIGIVQESKSNAKKRFLLGRDTNLKAIADYCDSGDLQIRGVSSEDDGFHFKQIGQDFVIAGANPRAVLYGVYTFEDFVSAGADGRLDIKKVPYYRKRGSGPCYSFSYKSLLNEDFPEEKAIFLSRLGINQMTDQGVGGHLDNFVKSDMFPFQYPPNPEFQRRVKAMTTMCKKYGIDTYLFLAAPTIPAASGNLSDYPNEVLGRAKLPWGGDKDNLETTLCVSSPLTQEYLRDMMKKLVREYPDLTGVQLYNMDGQDWLCTPELCDNCKAVCKDSPSNIHNPWETQALLVTTLAEAAHEENPDFDFKLWGAVHYNGEHFDKMIHAAKGYNGLLSSWPASDRTLMVPDAAVPDPAFILSQKVCEERNIPFYMICEMNNLEQIPKSLPFPFHVCDALKKYKFWGVKCLTEIFGIVPEHNSINALVTKEFEWDPDQDTEEFLSNLSVRQFGQNAGKLVYQSWVEMKKAFDVWNDETASPFPLAGSQFNCCIGTSISGLPPSILPDESYTGIIDILAKVEPWFADGYEEYKKPAFLDKMQMMNTCLSQAADVAKQAIATTSEDDYIGICYYESLNGRPTCREYAEMNYAPIAIADALCRQRCNIIRAYHLLKESETDNQELYLDLVREDIGVQESFCNLLLSFVEKRPCYTRTSLTEPEISDFLCKTREKIEKLKEYLDNHANQEIGVPE